jgi:hypothetical protein
MHTQERQQRQTHEHVRHKTAGWQTAAQQGTQPKTGCCVQPTKELREADAHEASHIVAVQVVIVLRDHLGGSQTQQQSCVC